MSSGSVTSTNSRQRAGTVDARGIVERSSIFWRPASRSSATNGVVFQTSASDDGDPRQRRIDQPDPRRVEGMRGNQDLVDETGLTVEEKAPDERARRGGDGPWQQSEDAQGGASARRVTHHQCQDETAHELQRDADSGEEKRVRHCHAEARIGDGVPVVGKAHEGTARARACAGRGNAGTPTPSRPAETRPRPRSRRARAAAAGAQGGRLQHQRRPRRPSSSWGGARARASSSFIAPAASCRAPAGSCWR